MKTAMKAQTNAFFKVLKQCIPPNYPLGSKLEWITPNTAQIGQHTFTSISPEEIVINNKKVKLENLAGTFYGLCSLNEFSKELDATKDNQFMENFKKAYQTISSWFKENNIPFKYSYLVNITDTSITLFNVNGYYKITPNKTTHPRGKLNIQTKEEVMVAIRLYHKLFRNMRTHLPIPSVLEAMERYQ